MVASFAALAFVSVFVAAFMGWSGLLQTRTLLRETEAERGRAESNLGLSLQAFDDIFDAIAGQSLGDRLSAEFGDPDRAPAHASPVSAQNAAMLERLVEFYDRFAEANRNNPVLQRATARAHRRVGDINRALGRLDLAQESYEAAMGVLSQLPVDETLVDRSGIRNAQGSILALLGKVGEAGDAHQEALLLLEGDVDPSDEVRALYERIRCYERLGVLASGPDRKGGGGRRPRRENLRGTRANRAAGHFDRAVELSETLTQLKPDEPESHLMLATGLRGLALVTRYTPRHEESVQCLVRAKEILRMLMKQDPDATTFKYELAELITSIDIRALLPDEISDALGEFEVALGILAALSKQHPDMPRYATSLARVHGLIGDIKRQADDDDGALASYRESLRIHNQILTKRPNLVVGRWHFARVQQELVFLLVDNGRLEDAIKALRESIKGAEAASLAGVGDRRHQRFLERQQEMLRRFQDMLENP
jgi:tetratricopeptide (TPR) repeat protein